MSDNIGRYDRYTGQESEVSLTEITEDNVLKIIGSKAFLSCKTVERLILPPTIETIEDWGFAHMRNLREIWMPSRTIQFGKQVFLGCGNLQRVVLYCVQDQDRIKERIPLKEIDGLDKLRASMFRFFPQELLERLELFEDEKGQRQWLLEYDEALESYLHKPDDTGFEPAFIGWFDVEDVDDQRQRYILNAQIDKLMLIFQRLLCTVEPKEPLKKYLHSLILKHSELMKDFLISRPECGRDIRYYKIWHRAGGLQPVAEELLAKLPYEEPEIRAFLMELLKPSEEDFFRQLEL